MTDGLIPGNAGALDATARDTVDNVIAFYGEKSAQWLSDLTHNERPWIDARSGLRPGERGAQEITPAAMAEYSASL